MAQIPVIRLVNLDSTILTAKNSFRWRKLLVNLAVWLHLFHQTHSKNSNIVKFKVQGLKEHHLFEYLWKSIVFLHCNFLNLMCPQTSEW